MDIHKDTALTMMQLLTNLGTEFEDEKLACEVIAETLKNHTETVNNVVLDDVMQTLPKRLSNSAYIRAKHSRYEDFMEWWDKQV